MNVVILLGRIGKDLQLEGRGGKSFLPIRLAVEYKGKPSWFDVECWDRVAEAAASHLSRGRRILVEGRLSAQRWKADDGSNRYKTAVTAQRITYLDGGRSGSRSVDKEPEEYTDEELNIDSDYDFDELSPI